MPKHCLELFLTWVKIYENICEIIEYLRLWWSEIENSGWKVFSENCHCFECWDFHLQKIEMVMWIVWVRISKATSIHFYFRKRNILNASPFSFVKLRTRWTKTFLIFTNDLAKFSSRLAKLSNHQRIVKQKIESFDLMLTRSLDNRKTKSHFLTYFDRLVFSVMLWKVTEFESNNNKMDWSDNR